VSRTFVPRSPLRGGSGIASNYGALYRVRTLRSTEGPLDRAFRILPMGMKEGYSQPMSRAKIKRKQHRDLQDLISLGPAMVRDLQLLGVGSVAELARQNPENLYKKLCRIIGERQDICVLDVFRAGVAQARNPRLPAEQCQWWYWSRRRKAKR
jgi:hypothetical protein